MSKPELRDLAVAEGADVASFDLDGARGGSVDRAAGLNALRVERPGELDEAIRAAFAEPGPVLLDVRVSPEENCFPMIPAGAAARDMVG